MDANERLDRLAGILVGTLTALLLGCILFWNSGCNASPEANRIRTTNAVATYARIAVAEGDLEADQLPRIVKALRAAAKSMEGRPISPGEGAYHAAALAGQFELDAYASSVLSLAFTEMEVYLSENGTGLDSERATQAAAFLLGIADGLESVVVGAPESP